MSEFVTASEKYVKEQLSRADVGKDGRLSQVDSARLPKDLQDNLTNFKSAKEIRGAVSAKSFSEAFVKYVAAVAKRADRDGDGYLTAKESKGLPKDLRDNYWNYYRATQAKGIDTADLAQVTQAGRAALADHVKNVLFNTAEPEGQSFRDECLDGRTTGERATKVKAEMLAEAAQWAPGGIGAEAWEKYEGNDWQRQGEVTYAGRFWGLYTEVRFKPNQRPEVYVEID
ncbi:MAG: hypothetical protein HYZ28_13560 [Myxococcales bacterium]|nr:hypothetical protein [Myxococcales bacterium]